MTAKKSKQQSNPEVTSKKRPRDATSTLTAAPGNTQGLALTDAECTVTPPEKKPKLSSLEAIPEEKRLRRFRKHAPSTYLEKLERATTQRLGFLESDVI